MIVLTDIQKQNILKYVEDKTYFNRLCFIIGVVMFIVCLISFMNSSKDSETFYKFAISLSIGLIILISTFNDILKFRNVRYQLDNNSFVAIKKYVKDTSVSRTVQETSYGHVKSRHSYYRNDYKNSRSFKVIIQKYYIVDNHGNKYECIKYLDYRKCIESGEFISVDFPTGEKFALYE